ncbi:low temperature requirement protein A [Arthrobacter sp. ISL-30]|uniref:low temperature requirement protein A n=1 Tax=Arthrobacter sp. ISL-30 TaxID=2819109 RepID=UPI0027DF05A1|nr:low temperature requirement protein A [Arthrobacter sp. ISL-30]
MPDRSHRNPRAIVANHGWSVDAALVGLGGTGLAFTLWWVYFILPSGRALHLQRDKSFIFGYGHMVVFAAIAATGAGLHVLAYYIDHEAHISAATAIAMVAVPVAIYKMGLTYVYSSLVGLDGLHLTTTAVVVAGSGLSIALAATGVPVTLCLLVLILTPATAVIVDEAVGHRHRAAALERLGARFS